VNKGKSDVEVFLLLLLDHRPIAHTSLLHSLQEHKLYVDLNTSRHTQTLSHVRVLADSGRGEGNRLFETCNQQREKGKYDDSRTY